MPDTFGATHPSSDGPSMSPATISAMTGGWPRRRRDGRGQAREDEDDGDLNEQEQRGGHGSVYSENECHVPSAACWVRCRVPSASC